MVSRLLDRAREQIRSVGSRRKIHIANGLFISSVAVLISLTGIELVGYLWEQKTAQGPLGWTLVASRRLNLERHGTESQPYYLFRPNEDYLWEGIPVHINSHGFRNEEFEISKPNDIYRIIRALETIEATGMSISEYHDAHRFSEAPFDVLKIGLNMDRTKLYERINQRVDVMITAGFVDEVKKLLNMGYSPDLKSMQSIGYRHMVDYIEGRLRWQECMKTLKRDHRRYAKRQLTWFGADDEIIWKKPGHLNEITTLIQEFLR